MAISIKFVHELDAAQYADLCKIMIQPETSQWLSDGRPWTPQRMLELRNWSAQDCAKDSAERRYFYWGILRDSTVVGIVGLHPVMPAISKRGLQIMYAIAPEERGKGIAPNAIRLATNHTSIHDSRALYAVIREDNVASMRAIQKSEMYVWTKKMQIDGRTYIVFHRKRSH